jgi:hypothetical protein
VRRVALERVLLLDAFINRGKLGFRDYMIGAQPAPHQISEISGNKSVMSSSSSASMLSSSDNTQASAIVAGEDNFIDKTVWGGFQVAEVNVFSDPGQGIFGISTAVAGDGNGTTELLPKGGVMHPHGQPQGKLLSFKLRHPYEHISEVTLFIR